MSTTSLSVTDLIGDLSNHPYNPSMIIDQALDAAERIHNREITIVNAASPFVFGLENAAYHLSAFLEQNELATRRTYALNAQSLEDLYMHMSDKDYVDRFAVPADAKFTLLFGKSNLIGQMVYDAAGDYYRVTIPRNTYFKIAEVTYSIQYPIEIRRFSHGGLQVVYLNDKPSPLSTLSTNAIQWRQLTDSNGVEWVSFDLDVSQFNVETYYTDVSASSGFKTSINLTDQFYYIRVWLQNSDKTWREIKTTHNQQLYDATTATAVVRVLESSVDVTIPVVYTTNGMVSGKMRIDLYQTKGPIEMSLAEYDLSQYSITWHSCDDTDENVFTNAMNGLSDIAAYSQSHVVGGRPGLSFEELKTRVIQNAVGAQDLPITSMQLQTALSDDGYVPVTHIDEVTGRVFWATKPLPKAVDERILTAAAASMSSMAFTLDEIRSNHGVVDNGARLTLTSSCVYQDKSGKIKPITEMAYQKIIRMEPGLMCQELTQGKYFYSPFTYILDTTGSAFEIRPYYLDGPTVISKNFISENPSTQLQVSVSQNYGFEKLSTGYRLYVVCESTQQFKDLPDGEVFAILSFMSQNKSKKVHIFGTQAAELVNGERAYYFDIDSNFDVDKNDLLYLTNIANRESGLVINASLTQSFDLIFGTTTIMPNSYHTTSMDDLLVGANAPAAPKVITHEQLLLRFGDTLPKLWAASRSALGPLNYTTYPSDVQATYLTDIYDVDPTTASIFKFTPEGEIQFLLKHGKGDPVFDEHGKPVLAHRAGDVMFQNGKPVVSTDSPRSITRFCDIFTVEGVYRFANDPAVIEYRERIVDTLLTYIREEVPRYDLSLLDQTKLFYYPKISSGMVKVRTADNREMSITAGQSLVVRILAPKTTMEDAVLLAALRKTTISVIDAALKNALISASRIQDLLLSAYGNDVLSVTISGLGPEIDGDQSLFTILDPEGRCSLRKRLTVQLNRLLFVEEDITIAFAQHGD